MSFLAVNLMKNLAGLSLTIDQNQSKKQRL
jgi:hypothetical protein